MIIFSKDKSRTILLICCCDLILKFELTFATLKLKTKAFTFQKALQYLYLDDERIVKVKSEVSWKMVLCLFTIAERLFCWFAGLCITFPLRFLIRFVWNHHPIKLFVETNYLFQHQWSCNSNQLRNNQERTKDILKEWREWVKQCIVN